MKFDDFKVKALAHYKGKLAEEKARWGVLAISGRFIENNASRIVEENDGGMLWRDLSEQSGLHLTVDYANDPQVVFAILSKEEVPHPHQLYELWSVVEDLENPDEADDDLLATLDLYDGPYKLDIPDLD